MPLPLCFVLMPFGRKPTSGGAIIDFDAVYRDFIAPAIADSGLEPLRADEEQAGGVIHKPMFERLVLCEYAVADLTSANANVFYELGVRHAVKPASTILVFARGADPLPFDVSSLRGLPYRLGPNGRPMNAVADRASLTQRLVTARDKMPDSPVFQLLEGFPDIQRLKTDVFRERVEYNRSLKALLATARRQGAVAVQALAAELAALPGGLAHVEAGVAIDLYLSFRAVKEWQSMIDLAGQLSPPIAATPLVREQLALALNRAGKSEEAEAILRELIDQRGPSSETCGILGRVYKDRWEVALKASEHLTARGLLELAISAYLRGFETDWRDAYPGVNAVTLMELKETPDPRQKKLLPVVAYAVEQRISGGQPDYWDYATLLELAVLARDRNNAEEALAHALATARETWEPETTARNLRLIREARDRRAEPLDWSAEVEKALENKAKQLNRGGKTV